MNRMLCTAIALALASSPEIMAQDWLPSLIKRIKPAVVTIITYDIKDDELSRGTGFFVDSRHVISCRHVLENAIRGEIRTMNGKIRSIEGVRGEDRERDLILLQIKQPTSQIGAALPLSKELPQEGERIVVIGSPLGLEQTASDGIVSSVRNIEGLGHIIQITAPISSGSSGSPVVNRKGEVVGVAELSFREGQNLNFAVPIPPLKTLSAGKLTRLAVWTAGRITTQSIREAKELFSTGRGLVWSGQYDAGLSYLEKAVERDPNLSEAWLLIGFSRYMLKRYETAIEPFKQAITLDPKSAGAQTGLGLSYAMLKRYQEALNHHMEAIRLNPDDEFSHRLLGMSYLSLGRHQEAMDALNQSLRLDPNDSDAYMVLAGIYDRLERYGDALEAAKRAIRAKPQDAQANFVLAVAYIGLERYMEALNPLQLVTRVQPDNADAHFLLATCYLARGDKDSALKEYKILRSLNSDRADTLFNLIYR